jgi:LmbE family N-acetylglucosaminyl deacetylase
MNTFEFDNISRGMVVVAHADDAEWGYSGTVAKLVSYGVEMTYIICTDGSKGSDDPEMTSGKLTAIRMEEQKSACRVLGVANLIFLGYSDSLLEPSLALRKDIVRQIRTFKPDLMICQSPLRNLTDSDYIGHPDHIAAGEATLSAVFPTSRDRLTFPELAGEGLTPHKVTELLVGDRNYANKWVDVTAHMDVAVKALLQHVSQISNKDVGKHLKDSRANIGESVKVKYAESYRSYVFS